jgi:alkanesulfonate monooxygenase SsuD/methylene tetrahydromethanopterin reductase-like flavin-dependent oxidoreductase (luciferase family)
MPAQEATMNQRAQDVLGRIGVWTQLDGLDAKQLRDVARKIEAWGYGALWTPEAIGRDPFAVIAYLAGQTERASPTSMRATRSP